MERNNREAKKHQRYTPRPPWRPGSVYEKVECKSPKWPLRRTAKEEAEGRKLEIIPGFERYAIEVTRDPPFANVVIIGVIKYSKKPIGSLVTLTLRRDGYWTAPLSHVSNRKKYVGLHRLVLLAFRGGCPSGYNAAHLNGDKSDNRISNLQWVKCRENSWHRWNHGTIQGRIKTKEDALRIIRLYRMGVSFVQIANTIGCNVKTATNIVRGRSWVHLRVKRFHENRRLGSGNRKAKMTEQRVSEMREMRRKGFGTKQLANIFGMSIATTTGIIRRLLWKHVA